MARHVMTARRKAALKKAQLSSARKRRRRIIRNVAIGTAVVGTAIALAPVARTEYKWHAGRGASRQHFRESNAEMRALYQMVGTKGMTPRERGAYAGYRYYRARNRMGIQSHGPVHRLGLGHGPSQRRRIHAQQRRIAAHGHRIRTM